MPLNIRNHIRKQIPEEIFEKAEIFHLRGDIDYRQLNFVHRQMMKFLCRQLSKIPPEKRDEDTQYLIDTYGGKVELFDPGRIEEIWEKICETKQAEQEAGKRMISRLCSAFLRQRGCVRHLRSMPDTTPPVLFFHIYMRNIRRIPRKSFKPGPQATRKNYRSASSFRSSRRWLREQEL